GPLFGAFTLLALLSAHRPLRFGLTLGAILLAGHVGQRDGEGVLLRDRGFFGAIRVSTTSAELSWAPGRDPEEKSAYHALYHGATLHGLQATTLPLRALPLAYYSENGPIGQVFLAGLLPSNARVAVVGLGVGALMAYGEAGQSWVLYEIDPKIAAVAQNPRYFTYLSGARAPYEIVLGDARLSLSREHRPFDLIVLDAYSSDSVPVHLLTREAVQLYLERLTPTGLLAFHLSNRYLDLFPVVAGIAEALGLAAMERFAPASTEDQRIGIMPARWAIVARRPEDFGALREDPRWKGAEAGEKTVVWTDDYSSVVSVLR
ncbi:MAG: fused MFS/spermidine synthase, partial [Minicystis sp.]